MPIQAKFTEKAEEFYISNKNGKISTFPFWIGCRLEFLIKNEEVVLPKKRNYANL